MKILFLDGHNLMHRARSGFQLGDYNVVFNFFRSLKPLIDKFKPGRVYFTLEGHPKKRYELFPDYKANRIIDQTTEDGKNKYKSLEDFFRQKDLIVDLLSKHFPVSVMRHPDYEADDLIYNIIKNASSAIEFIVVSSDTDFIQLLLNFPNVKLYNPVSKNFIEAPEYDYVLWKSLRGDSSDNIPKISGIGDQKALELVNDPDALLEFVEKNHDVRLQVERNLQLIRFASWSVPEFAAMESSSPTKDWDVVKSLFENWKFQSMTKEPYWTKFLTTFDQLWG